MDKNEATLRELRERGATRAVVHFSGGGDEGHCDSIQLFAGGERPVGELSEHHAGQDRELADALCAPVYNEYGGFSGEFHVVGTLTWDVATGKLRMEGSEDETVSKPFSKEIG